MADKNWTIDPEMGVRFDFTGVRDMPDEQLDVAFQPILAVENHQVFAHEVLVRPRAPDFPTPPALFDAAVMEQCTGRLGRRIRERATSWSPGGALFINIHPEELSERWLVRPDDPIGFYDHDVYLEITEAATFSHFELCMDVLRDVRSRTGAQIVIDDFGAGYSNLKRIVDLTPAIVKLDRVLIAGLDRDRRRQSFLRGFVDLLRQVGCRVVAEGIETDDELRASVDIGAQFVQGYLLGRPAHPPPIPLWPAQIR